MKKYYPNNEIAESITLIFSRRLMLLLFVAVFSANFASAQTIKSQIEIKIFFASPDESWSDCAAVTMVKRTIKATKQPANMALKLLFAGPTEQEKQKGMEPVAHLGDFFIGVTVRKGKAIVNFRKGARKYMHVEGAFCEQQHLYTAIDKTLLQFRSIKSVDYAINGKIIEDWDV